MTFKPGDRISHRWSNNDKHGTIVNVYLNGLEVQWDKWDNGVRDLVAMDDVKLQEEQLKFKVGDHVQGKNSGRHGVIERAMEGRIGYWEVRFNNDFGYERIPEHLLTLLPPEPQVQSQVEIIPPPIKEPPVPEKKPFQVGDWVSHECFPRHLGEITAGQPTSMVRVRWSSWEPIWNPHGWVSTVNLRHTDPPEPTATDLPTLEPVEEVDIIDRHEIAGIARQEARLLIEDALGALEDGGHLYHRVRELAREELDYAAKQGTSLLVTEIKRLANGEIGAFIGSQHGHDLLRALISDLIAETVNQAVRRLLVDGATEGRAT